MDQTRKKHSPAGYLESGTCGVMQKLPWIPHAPAESAILPDAVRLVADATMDSRPSDPRAQYVVIREGLVLAQLRESPCNDRVWVFSTEAVENPKWHFVQLIENDLAIS